MFVCFDVEATGLLDYNIQQPEYQPRIIEFGAIDFDGKAFSTLINPGIPIPAEVVKITQITDEMVKDAPSFKLAHKSIADFFTGQSLLVTYNGPAYDLPVLMNNLVVNGLQYQFPWPRRHIDLMQVANDYMGMAGKTGNKYPKLSELYQHLFGEEIVEAHRALPDAVATMRCTIELEKKGLVRL